MAIRAVTYYEAVCDDCGLKTGDLWGDFSAWSDPDTPVAEWESAGGYSGEFGEFCEDCRPRCPHGEVQEDDGMDEDCAECRADRAGGQVMGPIEQDRRDFMAAFRGGLLCGLDLGCEADLYAYIEARVAAREIKRAGDDAAGARDGHSASSRVWARSGRWEAKWRRMLAEPTGQDHRCSPYWSRSICGGCGGQEANCDKCGRLMCCEPTGQEGDQ